MAPGWAPNRERHMTLTVSVADVTRLLSEPPIHPVGRGLAGRAKHAATVGVKDTVRVPHPDWMTSDAWQRLPLAVALY